MHMHTHTYTHFPDTKPSKGLMESQGFMDALSSQVQAERMRSKEKKAKKLNKTTKLTRTNSNGGSEPMPEVKVEPTTPTKAAPTEEAQEQKEEEQMEGECGVDKRWRQERGGRQGGRVRQ